MSKPTAKELLAMDEEKFLEVIAPFVQPKPWKHRIIYDGKKQENICVKCGARVPNPDNQNACSIPDPIPDPLPVVVEKLKRKYLSNPSSVLANGDLRLVKIVQDITKNSLSYLSAITWLGWEATPRQQAVCLFVAMKEIEIC